MRLYCVFYIHILCKVINALVVASQEKEHYSEYFVNTFLNLHCLNSSIEYRENTQ